MEVPSTEMYSQHNTKDTRHFTAASPPTQPHHVQGLEDSVAVGTSLNHVQRRRSFTTFWIVEGCFEKNAHISPSSVLVGLKVFPSLREVTRLRNRIAHFYCFFSFDYFGTWGRKITIESSAS